MYFLIFIFSFLLTIFFVLALEKIAIKYRFYDEPGENVLKIHKKPISYLGGLAIFSVFLILFSIFLFLSNSFKVGVGIILASFFPFAIGFWDDFQWKRAGVSPWEKLLFLVFFSLISAIALVNNGIKIEFLPGIFWSFIFTFFYILGSINAINFEDGIDGLAGGLVAISLVGFIFLSIISGNNFAQMISLITLGAVLGFLILNFPPAKIFMGDSGAYFLGFILAILAVIFAKPHNITSILGPLFIIGLPIFDTGFAITRRLISRKSPFIGDRGHFYDKIRERGFGLKKTILFAYFFQLIFVCFGVLIYSF